MHTRFYLFIPILLILLACGGDPTVERGKAFLETGDTTAAIQQFEAAIQQSPANAEAYYQLGLAYEGLGDTTQAVNAFRDAAKLASKRAEITLALGRVYWHSGNRSLARPEFQKLLSDSPQKRNLPSVSRSHRGCLPRPTYSH